MTTVLSRIKKLRHVFNAQVIFLDNRAFLIFGKAIFLPFNMVLLPNWTDDRCVIKITGLVLTQYGHLSFLSMLFRFHHVRCILTTTDVEGSNIPIILSFC